MDPDLEIDFDSIDWDCKQDEEGPELGGFDCEFIEEILPGQKCVVCLRPMRDAVQTAGCGHRFCRSCLKRSISTNNSICPTCRATVNLTDGFYRDIAWSRDIMSLHVKCQMSVRGCDWTGEVRHAENHQMECKFADVTCDQCQVDFQRRHQEIHLTEQCPYRVVECRFCKDPVQFYIKPEHEDEYCTRFPLACNNHCGSTDIPREEMEVHLSDLCPMTGVVCPYYEAGCLFEDKRAYLGEHIDLSTEDHMQLLLTSLLDAKQQLSKVPALEEKVKNMEEENRRLTESEAKKSEETADIALSVKQLELDKMITGTKLDKLGKRVQGLQEENVCLKQQILCARRQAETACKTRKDESIRIVRTPEREWKRQPKEAKEEQSKPNVLKDYWASGLG